MLVLAKIPLCISDQQFRAYLKKVFRVSQHVHDTDVTGRGGQTANAVIINILPPGLFKGCIPICPRLHWGHMHKLALQQAAYEQCCKV